MKWGIYASLFFFGTFKFMFTPFSGPFLQLNFFETFLSVLSGGLVSATVFYFLSDWVMEMAEKRKKRKIEEARTKGAKLKKKKVFTWANKTLVKLKLKAGIWGVCWFATLFLSVPIGSIISARLYGKQKKTFPIIVICLSVDCLVITSIAYIYTLF